MKTSALRKAAKRRANAKSKKPNKRLIKKATKNRKKAETLPPKTMDIKTKSPFIHEETGHMFNERENRFKNNLDFKKTLAEVNRKYRESKKKK
jgi:hypothetical protein